MNWWKVAFATAVSTGIFVVDDDRHCCQVEAAFFAESPRVRRSKHRSGNPNSMAFIFHPSDHRNVDNDITRTVSRNVLFVGSTGWDNEDFLEALGKGSDALEKANEDYRKQSRFGNMRPASAGDDDDGEDMVDDLGMGRGALPVGSSPVRDESDMDAIQDVELSKDQIERIKRQNEEDSGSGEMFKKMLERAQQGATLKDTVQPPPPSIPSTASTTTSSVPSLPEGFEKLSVEAQAALFRQLMASPQPPRDQWPAAPGPRPEAKGQAMVAADGRKIGRNKDADSLVNSSDVYFAQLKLDSAVRNQARRQGDAEKADAVFADPTIPEIKLHINPYMEEQRKKELAMIETAADEMFTPEILGEIRKEVNVNDRGVSYKEMLEQRKKAAQQQSGRSSSSSSSSSISSSPVFPLTPPPAPTTVEPPRATTMSSSAVAPATVIAATPASATMKSEDDTRRDIRTLMGLLIKHRGGPGFGAGRIVGAEMERFASLSAEVVSLLRHEVRTVAPLGTPAIAPSTNLASGGAVMPNSAAPVGDRMTGVLACIEGAITMYKNSPPELQQSVLLTLRAALLSALNTCNVILGMKETEQYPALQSQSGMRMESVMACIEGAITMYRNSPPELQPSVLMTLRAALLSAVNACDELVAVAEIEQYTTPTDPRTRTTNPTQYYDVTPEFSERPAISASPSTAFLPSQQIPSIQEPMDLEYGTDRNAESSAFLESVYEKLKNAAGDGKMGLRDDLTAAEAEELANDISRMRAILVEELNGTGVQREPESQPPAAAQYKQMLAKVRADKDAAGNN